MMMRMSSLTDEGVVMSATSATLEQVSQTKQALEISFVDDSSDGEVPEEATIYYPITQRDPNDIRTILRLSLCSLCFAVLSLALAGLLTYRLSRSAELIVVERTPEGDRVVGDDRQFTLPGSVQLRPDSPGDGDKKYLAARWAESFFKIDPQTRRADIVRGLKLMTPDAAVALVDQVKQSGEWERQRREEWQTVWKPQVITLSLDDPYKVQVVGHQAITKTMSGVVHHSSRQLICTLALRPDTAKRTDDNQNTGFRIAGIVDMKVLEDAAAPASPNATPTISVAPPQ
jgi:hypothetical protein